MASNVDLYATLVDVAKKYIGTIEVGGDNKGACIELFQKALDGKAQGEPWCAAFVCYCIKEIFDIYGVKSPLTLSELVKDLWEKNPRAQKALPQPGYIACWKFKGTSLGHTGIVVSKRNGSFETVEGNTGKAPGIEREGDGVYLRQRTLRGSDNFILLGFLDPWM
jgi:hypothetical protein